jgi:hypothetical protein
MQDRVLRRNRDLEALGEPRQIDGRGGREADDQQHDRSPRPRRHVGDEKERESHQRFHAFHFTAHSAAMAARLKYYENSLIFQ